MVKYTPGKLEHLQFSMQVIVRIGKLKDLFSVCCCTIRCYMWNINRFAFHKEKENGWKKGMLY